MLKDSEDYSQFELADILFHNCSFNHLSDL